MAQHFKNYVYFQLNTASYINLLWLNNQKIMYSLTKHFFVCKFVLPQQSKNYETLDHPSLAYYTWAWVSL